MELRELNNLMDTLDEVNYWLGKTSESLKIARKVLTDYLVAEEVRAGNIQVYTLHNRMDFEDWDGHPKESQGLAPREKAGPIGQLLAESLKDVVEREWEAVGLECNCYVKELDDEAQFTLRYGAHEVSCPVYHESADPVDKMHDKENKAHLRNGLGVLWPAMDLQAKQATSNKPEERSQSELPITYERAYWPNGTMRHHDR
jgi:hypothetical protein